jgi:uncharacterized protein
VAVPVQPADRVEALDVLRGVALFGVLTVNLVTIFRHSLFEEFLHGPEDAWARAVSFGLEFKALSPAQQKSATLLPYSTSGVRSSS